MPEEPKRFDVKFGTITFPKPMNWEDYIVPIIQSPKPTFEDKMIEFFKWILIFALGSVIVLGCVYLSIELIIAIGDSL